MRSALPKVLHPVCGRSMIGSVLETALELDPEALSQIGKRYERLDQLAMEHILGVRG